MERYYITDIFASNGRTMHFQEKMELDEQLIRDSVPVGGQEPVTYAIGLMEDQIMIRYVEEEVTYIADYETNESQEISGVHYDPVPVARKEKLLILKKRKENADTP